jgi:hypothetical protein
LLGIYTKCYTVKATEGVGTFNFFVELKVRNSYKRAN